MKFYLQQGDVLLKSDDRALDADAISKLKPTTIIHKGDVNSHVSSHPVLTDGENLFFVQSPVLMLHSDSNIEMRHRPVALEPGIYTKNIVLETDIKTQLPRPVVD